MPDTYTIDVRQIDADSYLLEANTAYAESLIMAYWLDHCRPYCGRAYMCGPDAVPMIQRDAPQFGVTVNVH